MKKVYVKPEINTTEGKKFEKVYSGGCSHYPDNLVGCGYGADWETGHAGDMSSVYWAVTSDHHTLAPGYVAGGDSNTSN